MSEDAPTIPRPEGRYVVCDEIAAGGTATVHFGRLLGQGFARSVAIKRLHPTYARDPAFVGMFLDEARIAARIRHPNVCAILDVATVDDIPCLILEYVHGEPLSRHIDASVARGEVVPFDVAAAIVCGMLQGLHVAHEATDEAGEPLHIIHRDVSPQNVLVGTDGVPRVVDFGMAKAMGRVQNTAEGQLKGKMGYMAPEQFTAAPIDRRVDIYSAAVVLWETLTGAFFIERQVPSAMMKQILEGELQDPRSVVPEIPDELAEVCMKGLSRNPDERYATALEMAVAIESAFVLPSPREIGMWVERIAGDVLRERAKVLARIEAEHASPASVPPPSAILTSNSTRKDSKRPTYVRPLLIVVAITAAVVLLFLGMGMPDEAGELRAQRAQASSSTTSTTRSLVAEAAPSAAPAPTQSPEPEAVVEAAASATSSPTPPRRYPSRGRCTPPYTIDKDGIRHPKRECLRLSPP